MPNRTISMLIERNLMEDRVVAASFHRHLLIDKCRDKHLNVDTQTLDRIGRAKIDDSTNAVIREVEVLYASPEERAIMAQAFADVRTEARLDTAQSREAGPYVGHSYVPD